METFAGITLLAIFIEGLITYLFGKQEGLEPSRPWIKYVALTFGVLLAIAYQVDLLAMAGLTAAVPYVGFIVSGLIIGRGSNYLNDVIKYVQT